jgi:hypothetical protein
MIVNTVIIVTMSTIHSSSVHKLHEGKASAMWYVVCVVCVSLSQSAGFISEVANYDAVYLSTLCVSGLFWSIVEFCGGQIDYLIGFSLNTFVSLCQYHSASALY